MQALPQQQFRRQRSHGQNDITPCRQTPPEPRIVQRNTDGVQRPELSTVQHKHDQRTA